MRFDPAKHGRRSIRLRGYDYASPGAYFLTICTQDRRLLFGEIEGVRMHLNDAGRMIEKWWLELANKFPGIELDAHIVMPNHFHGILKSGMGVPLTHPDLRRLPSLPEVVRWFKTMTTNEYLRQIRQSGWPPVSGKLWQRNYYEHIIRKERSLVSIREYIGLNPANWLNDRENPVCRVSTADEIEAIIKADLET